MPQAFVHETETAFQKGQLGIETTTTSPYAQPTAGTGATATIALGSVTITPEMMKDEELFTPEGALAPTVQTIGEESTGFTFEGMATFGEIGYFCKDVISDAQVDPITSSMVYTVEAGGCKAIGGFVTDWKLVGDKKNVKLSGGMKGRKAAAATPTASLTIPAQVPLPATGVVITINGVEQKKVASWEFGVTGLWDGVAYVNANQFTNMLQKKFSGTFKFKQAFDSQAQTVMAISSTVSCSIVITSGSKSVTIAFDATVSKPDKLGDEGGVYAITNNLNVMHKATKCIAVTIVNS